MISKVLRYGLYGSVGATASFIALDSQESKFLNSLGAVRFGRAAFTAVSIAIDYKLNLFNLDADTKEYEEALSTIHLRCANRLKELFCKNKGAFIKVGQHIGALDYLLPLEYVNTMKSLHDKAPESNVSELFETIETDLGVKVDDIFQSIDPKPIGTASLAQCHKAVLKDGSVVAIKIQHPTVKTNSHTDIKTMTFLVNCLAAIFPDFKFVWLAEETAKNLPIELDFLNEANNIEKIGKLLEKYKFVKIPKVYWQYCSDRVLTMEHCEGFRADDLDKMNSNRINVNKVSERLGVIFSEMIFLNGFVHCDPHPGNVLVCPIKNSKNKNQDFQIVLLDHGLYQILSKDFRYNYAKIWMSILEKDVKKLEELTKNFNVGDYFGLFACIITGRAWESILQGIDKVDFTSNESNTIKLDASKYLKEISIVLNLIPREMLLLLKTNDLLRGIESVLHTRNSSSSFIALTKCCVKLISSFEREKMSREQNENKSIQRSLDKYSYPSRFGLLKFYLGSLIKEKFDLFKIFSYEIFLKIFNL